MIKPFRCTKHIDVLQRDINLRKRQGE